MDISVNNGSIDVISSVNSSDAKDFFKKNLNKDYNFTLKDVSLEDAFIAITGKY